MRGLGDGRFFAPENIDCGGSLMRTSRRDFFKFASVGRVAATVFGFDLQPAYAQRKELKIAGAAEMRSTYSDCAVGCGVLM
jgi:anaerobic selenocysteine-containing dehydrogenase